MARVCLALGFLFLCPQFLAALFLYFLSTKNALPASDVGKLMFQAGIPWVTLVGTGTLFVSQMRSIQSLRYGQDQPLKALAVFNRWAWIFPARIRWRTRAEMLLQAGAMVALEETLTHLARADQMSIRMIWLVGVRRYWEAYELLREQIQVTSAENRVVAMLELTHFLAEYMPSHLDEAFDLYTKARSQAKNSKVNWHLTEGILLIAGGEHQIGKELLLGISRKQLDAKSIYIKRWIARADWAEGRTNQALEALAGLQDKVQGGLKFTLAHDISKLREGEALMPVPSQETRSLTALLRKALRPL